MKKNGFTLIELLAVIVILSIITLIATPIVLNVIDDARKSAAKLSASGVVDAARYHYYENMIDHHFDGTTNEYNEVIPRLMGEKPENEDAEIYINEDGEIALSIVYNGLCFLKQFNTSLEDGIKTDSCKLDTTVKPITDYAVVNFYDWDNVFLGSTIVPKGDARSYVNEYVLTRFIHPELQSNTNYSSIERVDNYRGKYPSISPTEGTTVSDGEKYRLTYGLDYVFYGKDIDSKYAYVSGWVEVDPNHLSDTWTNYDTDHEWNKPTNLSDFSNVEEDMITVKAAYKAGNKLITNNYTLVDTYYTKKDFGVYLAYRTFERIDEDGYGVRRCIQPTVRYDFSNGSHTLIEPAQTVYNHDIITTIYEFSRIHFSDDGSLNTNNYTHNSYHLVDMRAISDTESKILEYSFYRGVQKSPIFSLDDNMLYEGTLNFVKKMATNEIKGEETFVSQINIDDFRLLNLKAKTDGTINAIIARTASKKIVQAATVAYNNHDIDGRGFVDLTWYQMQYAILNDGAYVSKTEAETWCKANCSWAS